ncbi:MAG: hypothetical protein ACRDP8_01000 [Actinopolymorphaceae bacterium]
MKLSVLRRGLPCAAAAGVLVVALAACGTEQGTSPDARATATTSPTDSGPAMSPSTLVLHRTGGIAGFNDKLTVEPDGQVTLTSRGKEPMSCTVNPKTKQRLDAAAQQASESPAPKSRSRDGKKWATATPDELQMFLVIGDQRIQSSDLGAQDQHYRDLFSVLNDILVSASAIRAGEDAGPGSPCS